MRTARHMQGHPCRKRAGGWRAGHFQYRGSRLGHSIWPAERARPERNHPERAECDCSEPSVRERVVCSARHAGAVRAMQQAAARVVRGQRVHFRARHSVRALQDMRPTGVRVQPLWSGQQDLLRERPSLPVPVSGRCSRMCALTMPCWVHRPGRIVCSVSGWKVQELDRTRCLSVLHTWLVLGSERYHLPRMPAWIFCSSQWILCVPTLPERGVFQPFTPVVHSLSRWEVHGECWIHIMHNVSARPLLTSPRIQRVPAVQRREGREPFAHRLQSLHAWSVRVGRRVLPV
jgi:hypothetical protein